MLQTIEAVLAVLFDRGLGLAIIMGGGFLAAGFGTSYKPEDIPERYR